MSDWPPGCPRYKRQTLITVGDASGPHGCLACADLPKPGEASAVARIPEAKKRGAAVSGLWQMMRGDSLLLLRDLPSDSVDALITDPPYSSGGAFRGDRTPASSTKYVASDSVSGQALPEVLGDSRDQRGLLVWSSIWLAECYRVVRDGGFVAVFSDWRQLDTFGDAVQVGGFIKRGISPWIKPNARPQPGRPVQASEFVIWGSKGPMPFDRPCPVTPGYWIESPPPAKDREHMTEKPLRIMRDLAKSCIPGGTILDPFAGAGTTGVGALLEGRKFLGIELSAEYHARACRQLRETETETLAGADRGSTAIGQGALFAAVAPVTSAILAGLAALAGLATVAWHRYRRRAAEDARDRAMARADRAEADAAGQAEAARAAASQLARDRAGVRAAEEIRRAPPDPDPVAAVRAVDAAARRVRDSLPAGDGASPPAAVPPARRRPADNGR